MGWTVILEDENGQTIRTLSKEFIYDELENLNLDNYLLLKYIDFYGDSTFNTLQLGDLKSDFEKLRAVVSSQKETVEHILELIKESQEKVHTYIKFYGD